MVKYFTILSFAAVSLHHTRTRSQSKGIIGVSDVSFNRFLAEKEHQLILVCVRAVELGLPGFEAVEDGRLSGANVTTKLARM